MKEEKFLQLKKAVIDGEKDDAEISAKEALSRNCKRKY